MGSKWIAKSRNSTTLITMAAEQESRARLTAKGTRTRARIVDAALELVRTQGVADATLEQIKKTARVSSSQLYHYFVDKDEIIQAVIERQIELVIATQEHAGLGTPEGLQTWGDTLVAHARKVSGVGGHPLGHLVGQLAESDQDARERLAEAFRQWTSALVDALRDLQAGGYLRAGVEPENLARTMLATLQGGFLVSQVERDATFLETALDTMFALALNEPHAAKHRKAPRPSGSRARRG